MPAGQFLAARHLGHAPGLEPPAYDPSQREGARWREAGAIPTASASPYTGRTTAT